MAIPQHILYNIGNSITMEIDYRPASATVACTSGSAGSIFTAQTATIGGIDTTLNGAVTAGATTITVTDATGFTAGENFYIVGADGSSEQCTVKGQSSTTITLTRPLLNAYADTSTVESRKLTYTVTAAQAATRFWDGHLTWIADSDKYYFDHVVCTDYPLNRTAIANEQTLFKIEPLMKDSLDPNESLDRLLDLGFEDVLSYLNSVTGGRAWSFLGPRSFELAVGFAAMVHHYRNQPGEAGEELLERFQAAFQSEMKTRLDSVPRDLDMDGAVEDNERVSARSLRLYRS